MLIHNIHIRHVPISNPLPVVAYSVAMAKRFCIKYDTFVEHLKYCDTQMPHFLEMPSLVTKVTKFIVNQTAWLPREKNRQIYFYMYKIQKKVQHSAAYFHWMLFLDFFSISPIPSRTFVISYIRRFCRTASWSAALTNTKWNSHYVPVLHMLIIMFTQWE